jgi:carbamoyl-phosphate synthase large subunit
MKITKPKKIIILGSGALKIGEAGEFDYSGSQAIKAMKEEGIETILVNPNIATIQTSKELADKVYFLPVTAKFVERVIKKEQPDGILLAFGGQTALNCGVELFTNGILEDYNIKVLGTPVESIINTEDRELFVKKLEEINLKSPKSIPVTSTEAALKAATEIKYPVMIRAAYALGGMGSGVCYEEDQLKDMAAKAFTNSPQILVEEYLGGWKEVEYEVMRDCHDNCITVCNMENFDPLGIHTGESIVVAPSQTLTNAEYHKLREISINVIKHIGVVGECNIQFALDPKSEDYRIIEVNARLSRSSALASKATGYPLAFIAAKLALGYGLYELENQITKKTKACFEPALDYCVVKIPRWDLQKFTNVSVEIGTQMKSVGEVMAIGRKFEEALQKAVRMLEIGYQGITGTGIEFKNVLESVRNPTDKRLYALAEALKQNISVDNLYDTCRVDKWFLYKLKHIVDMEKAFGVYDIKTMTKGLLLDAKKIGFSDKQIGGLLGGDELDVRKLRKQYDVTPKINQIDTLAAEFPAMTNYLYLTYNSIEDDVQGNASNSILVLGSGAYRIGSSVEFDWCCVNAVMTAKAQGHSVTMVNYNPETVSTDYDICDKLYFEELSFEVVADIYEKEHPKGLIISMGGQIPNNIVMQCHEYGISILGTDPNSIDNAEDRHQFSAMLDELKIDQPEWKELRTLKEAEQFAEKVGYPVLIRPSYVLSGAAMKVVFDKEDLDVFLQKATDVSPERPVVVSKFILNAKEIEVDAVAQDGELLIYAISEHVENAGVHSGDATMIFPSQNVYIETIRRIVRVAKQIAKKLQITGPFNIQFLAKDNDIKVIECNLRASRSFPFVSKVSGYNFIEIATKSILGISNERQDYLMLMIDHVGVKSPQFSFQRLQGADPLTSVEMASTGEVACIGRDIHEAFLKSLLSVGYVLPQKKKVLVSISGDRFRFRFLESMQQMKDDGFTIYCTEGSAAFYNARGIDAKVLHKVSEVGTHPNIEDYLKEGKLDLVINIPDDEKKNVSRDGYVIRRMTVDFAIPLFTNLQLAKLFIDSICKLNEESLEVLDWDSYVET